MLHLSPVPACLHPLGKQIVPICRFARQVRTQPDEVNRLFAEFAADFVDSPVCIGQEKYVRTVFEEFFPEQVQKAVGGLSGAGRADDEEEVARLLGPFDQKIERAIVALTVIRLVDRCFPSAQDQVTAFLTGRKEAVEPPIER